ncbi:MoxR-like ATPases [Candidatus Brocadia sinica JPN1]|uniref:MoxR-like ATPases n=1 Tax=Candidatus Brocadia sinica JPN1 TaxID=1197129 RepID=A0ABQ0JZ44_9BACT|nr:MoxR-like ATPases [Candidatus Brocadia sinica JPN1]
MIMCMQLNKIHMEIREMKGTLKVRKQFILDPAKIEAVKKSPNAHHDRFCLIIAVHPST